MTEAIKNTIKRWWLLLIIGILAIVLGIVAFCNPYGTFEALSTIVIIFMCIFGVVKIIQVIKDRHSIPAWGWSLAAAIISLVLAVLILTLPYGKDLLLAFLAGFFIIFEGINTIFGSIALKQNGVGGWGWSLALGIITTVLGVWLLSYPIFSMTFVTLLFGFAFVFMGIDLIVSAISFSRLKAAMKKEGKKD